MGRLTAQHASVLYHTGMKQSDFGESLSLPEANRTFDKSSPKWTPDALLSGRDKALEEARYLFLQGQLNPVDYTSLLRDILISQEQRLGLTRAARLPSSRPGRPSDRIFDPPLHPLPFALHALA